MIEFRDTWQTPSVEEDHVMKTPVPPQKTCNELTGGGRNNQIPIDSKTIM